MDSIFFEGFEKSAAKDTYEDVKKTRFGSGVGSVIGTGVGYISNRILGNYLKNDSVFGKELPSSLPDGKFDTFKEYVGDLANKENISKAQKEELKEMIDLGDSFIKKHKLTESGTKIRSGGQLTKMVGPHYNPAAKTVNLSTSSPAIALHELGHAADYKGSLGLSKLFAQKGIGSIIAGSAPTALIFGDRIKKKIPGTVDDKVIDFIQKHPYLTAGTGVSMVALYPEAKASTLALKHMYDRRGKAGLIGGAKVLVPALGTYVSALGLPVLGTVAGADIMRRRQMKKQEKSAAVKYPELQAFLAAGVPVGMFSGYMAGSRAGREQARIESELQKMEDAAIHGKDYAQESANRREKFVNYTQKHPVGTGAVAGAGVGGFAALQAHLMKQMLRRR